MRKLEIFIKLDKEQTIDKIEFEIYKPDMSWLKITSKKIEFASSLDLKAVLDFKINLDGYYKVYINNLEIQNYYPKAFEINEGVLTKYFNLSPSWFYKRYHRKVCLNQLLYELKLAGFKVNEWKNRIISIERLLIFEEKDDIAVYSLRTLTKDELKQLDSIISNHKLTDLEVGEMTSEGIIDRLPLEIPFKIDLWLTGSPVLKGRSERKSDIDLILESSLYQEYRDKVGLFFLKVLKREIDVGQRFPNNYPRIKVYSKGRKVGKHGFNQR